METPSNYIADRSTAEQPPAWFLQQLYDFDAMLVVMPSKKTPGGYVLARRRQTPIRTPKELADTIVNPDTIACLEYGLVPVCMMFKTGPTWNADLVIARLQARDIWAHGGADAVADMLEQQEKDEQQARLKQIREDLWHRSGDGYRTYKRRTGQSVALTAPNVGTVGHGTSNPTPQ